MNILHLRYAVEIEKTKSISKAASNLFMAQPNLSRGIKDLEESIGITIFNRTTKGMTTTPKGEEFLRYAKSILKQMNELENMFKEEETEKNLFSISVPRASYISYAFARFSEKIEDGKATELFYKETNSDRTIRNVLQGDYKLGIIRYAKEYDIYFKKMLEEKGMSYELITDFTYQLAMSSGHKLAHNEDISFEDLEPFTEIAHADPFVPSLSLARVKKTELPDNINRRIYVFERASQFDLLSTDKDTFMWVSPLPEHLLKLYGLVQKKCECNKREYKDVLIYKKGYHLSELDRMFITEVCNSKRKYF